ncbi:hypothetical protein [Vibrio sp. PNB22_8_1]|uniref:hypothetical protein n=1 Tax=unclassified Vibrio TaxID=2614977 RepID=UPI00406A9642
MRKFLSKDLPMIPVFISILAIVLSQFPPMYMWFDGPEIKISSEKYIRLSRTIQGEFFNTFITIQNDGGKDGWINSIKACFYSDSFVRKIDGQSYLNSESSLESMSNTPLSSFYVPKEGKWEGYIQFYSDVISYLSYHDILTRAEAEFDNNFSIKNDWSVSNDLFSDIKRQFYDLNKKMPTSNLKFMIYATGEGGVILDEEIYKIHISDKVYEIDSERLEALRYGRGLNLPPRQKDFKLTSLIRLEEVGLNVKVNANCY